MVVAQVHERVPVVGQSHSAGTEVLDMDGEAIAVGEFEARAEHESAIRAGHEPHLPAQGLAEAPLQGARIEAHHNGSLRRS